MERRALSAYIEEVVETLDVNRDLGPYYTDIAGVRPLPGGVFLLVNDEYT